MDQPVVPGSSIAVRLLGGAAIEEEGRPLGGRAAHRHGLALLALLATADGPVSRDKVVAMLWPESDPGSVRHRLNVLLYELRKTLGRDAIVSTGDDLRLDPDAVAVDVVRFERALAGGDPDAAIEWYRGPFLDGFHLPDAPEFDEWASSERERLARAFSGALETGAGEAGRAGDLLRAVRLWRRLAEHDPYGSRATAGLVGALAASGEPAEALRVAERHARILAEELDAPPDPAVEALAERIRDGEDLRAAAAESVGPSAGPVGADAAPAVAGPSPEASAGPTHRGTRVPRRRWRVAAVAGLGAALLLLSLPWLPGGGTADEVLPDRVVVLPFVVRGGAEFAYLGDGMAEILAATLDGVGSLRTADPHAVLSFVEENGLDPADPDAGRRTAERFGAGRYLLGSIVESGRRLRVQATLYRADGVIEARGAAGAGGDAEFFDMVDELTRGLLVPRFDPDEERLARLAVTTSSSLAALKAYLEGESRLREGAFEAASEAYRRATREDSTFALAWYRLAVAAEWAFQPHDAAIAVERAVGLADRLPERDRLLLVGWDAYARGEADRAEAVYERVLDDWPEEVEAWLQLGEIRFHYAPSRGRTIEDSRAAFERVLELDPGQEGARIHLARAAALRRDLAELDRHLAWLEARDPRSQATFEARALRAFAARDRVAARVLAEELGGRDSWTALAALMGEFHVGDLDGVGWGAALLADAGRPPEIRTAGWSVLALARAARGRFEEADQAVAAAESIDPLRGGELRALIATLPFRDAGREALLAARAALDRGEARAGEDSFFLPDHDGVRPPMRIWLRGLIAAGLGEEAEALRLAARLDGTRGPEADPALPADLGRGVRADVHRRAGRAAEALAVLEPLAEPPGYELVLPSPFHPRARERYLLARLLEDTGRADEARAVYRSAGNRSLHDLPYRAPVHARRAALLERAGEGPAAAAEYARFALLWRAADPGLAPRVRGAVERYEALAGPPAPSAGDRAAR